MLGVVIAGLALLGVIFRPWRVNEAWWAAGGAVALVLARAVTLHAAGGALARGTQVYLFLIGMMALAEFARVEGVFDWIAVCAVGAARGSRARLLLLVYGAGIATTAFLSNDATIVVLTPAVLNALARTDAEPEPYVFACALVANAASFLLPIANPSNLLFFADGMPPLRAWLGSFALASLASIALTYAALALIFRKATRAPLVVDHAIAPAPRLLASVVLGASAAVLIATSSRAGPLGEVTFALGALATLLAATRERRAPLQIVGGIAWPVVALTAALFVLVEALDAAGAKSLPRALYAWASHTALPVAKLGVAAAAALASNLVNNLPVGLDLGKYVGAARPPAAINAAALVGINVGPNFSANGSLATLLWLAILRRAGVHITPLRFAAIGCAATPLALIAAALLTS
ncbi:MAG: SLC13 family permease [Candidatus Elarobacter sp.]